jgi:hypothetical protein
MTWVGTVEDGRILLRKQMVSDLTEDVMSSSWSAVDVRGLGATSSAEVDLGRWWRPGWKGRWARAGKR